MMVEENREREGDEVKQTSKCDERKELKPPDVSRPDEPNEEFVKFEELTRKLLMVRPQDIEAIEKSAEEIN